MPVRILIVDDHAIIREGLKMMFASLSNMAVVGEAENGRIAVEKADRSKEKHAEAIRESAWRVEQIGGWKQSIFLLDNKFFIKICLLSDAYRV
ncbi:MAG: response regulator transcription factor [Desulfuromonadaceae bacterium]